MPELPDVTVYVERLVRRMGKRIVLQFQGDRFIVFHLMIAGRLRWRPREAAVPKKLSLARFDFPDGTLLLTEAGSRHRASLHLVSRYSPSGSRASVPKWDRDSPRR